jgi:hypothetical protein
VFWSDIPRACERFHTERVWLSLNAAVISGACTIWFGPFYFIRTTDPVSHHCFTWDMIVFHDTAWPLLSLPNLVQKLCLHNRFCFHVTFHIKNMFFHTSLHHVSAWLSIM